jgi:hypothetical protein
MPAAPAGNSIVLIAAITGLYTENKTKALTTEDTEDHGGKIRVSSVGLCDLCG